MSDELISGALFATYFCWLRLLCWPAQVHQQAMKLEVVEIRLVQSISIQLWYSMNL